MSERTAEWLACDPVDDPAPWRLMIRPDVGLERRPDGSLQPVLFETNATGLAGLYNHAAGVRILRTEVFPRVYDDAEARALADPPDLLALVVRWIQRATRWLGRRRLRGVAFIEEAAPLDGYSEVPRLVAAVRAAGLAAERGTAADLRVTRGGVRLRNMAVDVVYRDLALEDVGAPVRPRALAGFRDRFDAGAVLPGVAGEFSQKGLLEYLGRPEAARLFTVGGAPAPRSRGAVDAGPGVSADGGSGRPPDRPSGVRAARAGAPSHQAERGLERLRAAPGSGGGRPPVGCADRPGVEGARPLGRPGARDRGRDAPWSISGTGGPTPAPATSPSASSTRRETWGSTSG